MKAEEVSSLQQKWLINEKKKLRGLSIKDIKREKRELEKSLETMWNEQGLPKLMAKISKKELRETENDMSIGGMRNPDLAVERLTLVREVGAKLREEWEKIYAEEPDFAEVGTTYGRREAKFDADLCKRWRDRMMSTLGGPVQMEGILLRANTEYKSPLDPELRHAWQAASKDPDLCLQQFIREGVPLGMSSKIPPSGGVFPPGRNQEIQSVEAQVEFEECQNMVNYSSVQEHPQEAEEETARYEAKGFVGRMSWAAAGDEYSVGTLSKLGPRELRTGAGIAWSYAWATHWILRAAEAAMVKAKRVSLKGKGREVRLFIPKSKTDQQAKGAWRTLQCCGSRQCDVLRPWNLAVRALSCLKDNESTLFPTCSGTQVCKEQMVRAWQNNLNPRMSGHSARRSGAMMYTRKGLGIYDISGQVEVFGSLEIHRRRPGGDASQQIPSDGQDFGDDKRGILPVQMETEVPKMEKKRKEIRRRRYRSWRVRLQAACL